jgi:hypothetical protein
MTPPKFCRDEYSAPKKTQLIILLFYFLFFFIFFYFTGQWAESFAEVGRSLEGRVLRRAVYVVRSFAATRLSAHCGNALQASAELRC